MDVIVLPLRTHLHVKSMVVVLAAHTMAVGRLPIKAVYSAVNMVVGLVVSLLDALKGPCLRAMLVRSMVVVKNVPIQIALL